MKKFVLIGNNINYSFSPILHTTIFNSSSIKATYSILHKNNITNIITHIKNNDISGFNVTIPYKENIIKFLDYISPEALEIGAVNCVKVINGKFFGYNTDYLGILETFKKMNLSLKNKKVFILGSGGAAKACWKSILDCNGIPIIVSRNPDEISHLFKNTKIISYIDLINEKGYLLINATPIGTYPNINESPVEEGIIQNFDFLLDLIYNPKETKFIKSGKKYKKICENGLFMLISQGVKSEEIWNNISINTDNIYNKLINIAYNKNKEVK